MINEIYINDETLDNDVVFYEEVAGKVYVIFKQENYNESKTLNFKKIKFEKVDIEINNLKYNNRLAILIYENDIENYKLIISLWDKKENIYEFHERWLNFFQSEKQIQSLKKFYGDFAELIFLNNYGGIKKHDSFQSDISINGKQYEIKSVSNHSYNVKISYRQLASDIPVVLFLLEESNENSINIIDLANTLSNQNIEFKEYIKKKYTNSEFNLIKFKLSGGKLFNKPLNIERIKKEIKFNNAQFSFNVDYENLEDINIQS